MKKRLSLLFFLVSLVCCCFTSNTMANGSTNVAKTNSNQTQSITNIHFIDGFSSTIFSGTSNVIAHHLTTNGNTSIENAVLCNVVAGEALGGEDFCYPTDSSILPTSLSAIGLFSASTPDGTANDISYVISGIGDTLITASDAGDFPFNLPGLHPVTFENDGDELCIYQMIYSSDDLIALAEDINVQIAAAECFGIAIPTTGSLEEVLVYIQAILDIGGANGTVADILSYLTPGSLEVPVPAGFCNDTILTLQIPEICYGISMQPYCYTYGEAGCCSTSASIEPVGNVCSNLPFNLSGTVGGNATMGTWSTSGDGTFGSTGTLSTTYTPGPQDATQGAIQIFLTTDDPDGPGVCEATTESVFALVKQAPQPSIVDPGTVCDGSSASLSLTETYTAYAWSTGEVSPTITITAAESYSVTVTDGNGCQGSTSITIGGGAVGCTNATACNYDATAGCDSGMCIFETTCNTDACLGDIQVWDTVSCGCIFQAASVSGCTDPTSCNYNSAANCNDGSCQPVPTCNTDPCLGDVTQADPLNPCNCVLSAAQVLGCTDATACNYNTAANCSDNSCITETGCDTDPCTNGGTTVWDSATCGCIAQTATVTGCTNATACNYDAAANCLDTSCIYESACDTDPCTNGGTTVWDSATCGCIAQTATVTGCTDATACNYDTAANCSDNSCITETGCDTDPCTNGGTTVWDSATCGCIAQTATVTGCTNATACNYDATANCLDTSCIFESACNTDPCLGDIQSWDTTNCACVVITPTVSGCTDATACNYNAAANCDDSSCLPVPTCNTDICAGDVTIVDPSNPCQCILSQAQVLGCTDATACNYNAAANCDDSSCLPVPTCNTDICVGDVTIVDPANPCQCILSVTQVLGCTETCAPNYNSAANCDDGSCEACIEDCGDPAACNYNSAATVINNELCDYGNAACVDPCAPVSGCIDAAACNFDAGACVDDGSCILETACDSDACTNGGIYTWDTNTCACALTTATVLGCDNPDACNYDSAANCDDGSCIIETACNADACTDGGVQAWNTTTCQCEVTEPTVLGCMTACAPNYDSTATCDDGSCQDCLEGCTDMTACNYDSDPTIVENNTLCIYEADSNCNTDCTAGDLQAWNTTTCQCEVTEPTVLGCMTACAPNYDSTATCDDGSCQDCLEGCTDMTACNYDSDPTIVENNTLCIYEADSNCNTDCTAGDLQEWDTTTCQCEVTVVTVSGCMDATACNYNADANCDDGSCDFGDPSSCNTDCTLGDITEWDAVNCECVVTIVTVFGCTDPNAINYNADANCEDGSCPIGGTIGCTDPCAPNYNMDADTDDGSCEVYDKTCNTDCTSGDITEWDAVNCECVVTIVTVFGCTDPNAINYNADANCEDGSCPIGGGCMDPCAPNFNPNAIEDDGSCQDYDTTCNDDPCLGGGVQTWNTTTCECEVTVVTVLGCTDTTANNYNADANCYDGSCEFDITVEGCTDPCAPNYDSTANTDDGTCEAYDMTCDRDACTNGGTTIWDAATCGCIADETTVEGCTSPFYDNYDPAANCNDDSCFGYKYCNDPTACNYSPNSNQAGAYEDPTACNFGNLYCAESCNVVMGCTDPDALNYNSDADCDDNSCIEGCVPGGCDLEEFGVVVTNTIKADALPADVAAIFGATGTNGEEVPFGTGVGTIDNDNIELPASETELFYDIDVSVGCITLTAIEGFGPPFARVLEEGTYDKYYIEVFTGNKNYPWFQILGACLDASSTTNANVYVQSGAIIVEFGPGDEVGFGNNVKINFSCDFGYDILGCTDPCSPNYSPQAEEDDGSCLPAVAPYDGMGCNADCTMGDLEEWNPTACRCDVVVVTVSGCSDTLASNYNADANCDDTCEYKGCTDPCAPNYDANATEDDGSCEAYDTTCNQDCTMGDVEEWDAATCGCVTVIPSIIGCTDKEACNFDPDASCNDGCDYSCYCEIDASVEIVCGPQGDKFQLIFLFSGSDNGSYLLTDNDSGESMIINTSFYQSPVYYIDGNEGFSFTVSLTSDVNCSQTLNQTFVDCIVTAIDMVSFAGNATEQGNRLDWTSASEFNSDSYIVEKSTNGTDFYEVGTVRVAGNSNVKNDYYFLDNDVKSTVAYYRLVELDKHGNKVVVTSVVRITRESNVWGIAKISPIPATNIITIDVNSINETNYTLEIYNVAGKLMKSTEGNATTGVNSLNIDISSLPIGTYFISLTNGSETQVGRFVKN